MTFPVCENCNQRNSLLYVAFPNNEKGFPYLEVCEICIGNIGSWAEDLRKMCNGTYKWNGGIVDGGDNLLWSEESGQLFDPNNDTRIFGTLEETKE